MTKFDERLVRQVAGKVCVRSPKVRLTDVSELL